MNTARTQSPAIVYRYAATVTAAILLTSLIVNPLLSLLPGSLSLPSWVGSVLPYVTAFAFTSLGGLRFLNSGYYDGYKDGVDDEIRVLAS